MYQTFLCEIHPFSNIFCWLQKDWSSPSPSSVLDPSADLWGQNQCFKASIGQIWPESCSKNWSASLTFCALSFWNTNTGGATAGFSASWKTRFGVIEWICTCYSSISCSLDREKINPRQQIKCEKCIWLYTSTHIILQFKNILEFTQKCKVSIKVVYNN